MHCDDILELQISSLALQHIIDCYRVTQLLPKQSIEHSHFSQQSANRKEGRKRGDRRFLINIPLQFVWANFISIYPCVYLLGVVWFDLLHHVAVRSYDHREIS